MLDQSKNQPLFTTYHSQYLAHRLTLEGMGDEALARSLSTARVEMKPHQVDAVLFALQSPLSQGVILADEVGLGKTIEAGLVVAQRWAERKRRILLVVPASLRKQWQQELQSKFSIPSLILEAKNFRDLRKGGDAKPFDGPTAVRIVSYEFADRQIDAIATVNWDLVVCDEAHRLRNVHKRAGSARAKNLKRALATPFKILLTATPLQNSLLELYGLVSIVDDHVFGDEFAFKANFMGRSAGGAGMLMLKDRLRPVLRRTLRKTVLEAGHINYTNRNLMVEAFEPSDKEHNLYLGVSAFLQRDDTILFGDRNNPLVLMGYQKILGSSTYAIAQTLDTSIETLKRRHRASLTDVADIETQDEWTEDADEEDEEEVPVDPVKLQAEIAELTMLRDLARSIGANAKGEKLVATLPTKILDEIEKKGGARKAVIFTESVRTQRYLRDLLAAHGFAGQIAIMNGANNDLESKAIYEEWRRRHAGTDVISSSKSADMKAAIVEAFRDEKTILIATESGAEGINLQFCSVVINFDLPWNPQRIEQRIGRCHRFGQKIDVTVVNFLNLKNRAEERVHELLQSKFNLFQGVFGASDQVLGVIGDGIDFESRILKIVQQCRNKTEVDAAFDALQADLEASIKADMQAARQTVIDNLDTSVVQRLKDRDGEIRVVLSEFDQALLTIVKAELPDARFHEREQRRFDHNGQTWTTEWTDAEANGWQFLRLEDGNLAQDVVARAQQRKLPFGQVMFRYDTSVHGGLGDVVQLVGKSGWLSAAKVTFTVEKNSIQRMVLAAVTDDGQPVDIETAQRFFVVPAIVQGETADMPVGTLEQASQAQLEAAIQKVRDLASVWFDDKTQQYNRYAADMEKALDNEVAGLEDRVKELREQSRSAALALDRKLELQREASKLDRQKDTLLAERFARKRKIQDEVDKMIEAVGESLKLEPQVEPLFTLRWELTR